MLKKLRIFFVLCGLSFGLTAQDGGTWQQKPVASLTGFMDVFYVYDFNRPQGTERQAFLFNHNRHNEFNLNLGLVKLSMEHPKYRANFALQTGTYANDNYAAEPGVLKNIFEGSIGISLNKQNNLWLVAGVLPSHIGFESAISMDNRTLTRSLLAENSPYFLTGAKLAYSPNAQWHMAVLMVNGWQRIQRLEGNSLPSFGTQLNYAPSENVSFNWSTFMGTDDPDTTRRMRYFNNLYGQFQVTEKVALITGFDLGAQQTAPGSSSYDLWLSPVLIGQYAIDAHWKTTLRAEYFQDATGVIIPAATPNGFQTMGLSFTLDYAPTKNVLCRLEGRWLHSRDPIFATKTGTTNNNFILGTSMAIKFAEGLGPKY